MIKSIEIVLSTTKASFRQKALLFFALKYVILLASAYKTRGCGVYGNLNRVCFGGKFFVRCNAFVSFFKSFENSRTFFAIDCGGIVRGGIRRNFSVAEYADDDNVPIKIFRRIFLMPDCFSKRDNQKRGGQVCVDEYFFLCF